MPANKSLQVLKGYIGAQHTKAGADPGSMPQPFVTLSRDLGAGGLEFSRAISEKLSARDTAAPHEWIWFDRELVEKVMEDHALEPDLRTRLSETHHNALLAWFDDAFGSRLSWSKLVRKTGETIVHLARLGNVIIVGRGAHVLTRGTPNGLHVRLIAGPEHRVAEIQEHFGYSPQEARSYMAKEDRSRAKYLRQYFDRDVHNPLDYDLTINMDHIALDDAVDLVVDQVMRVRTRLTAEQGPGGHASGRRSPAT